MADLGDEKVEGPCFAFDSFSANRVDVSLGAFFAAHVAHPRILSLAHVCIFIPLILTLTLIFVYIAVAVFALVRFDVSYVFLLMGSGVNAFIRYFPQAYHRVETDIPNLVLGSQKEDGR
ncbi:hypothetical protein BOTBODRAFT_38019 [Botryobasidium botryosum FD-172 SS1]|uniref:Uncharacterized protein n=1 Tax=Botryobasidium botryosum (strain FD-172 SS1) TaxID=930990 RepID=A0A067LY82_BOTB1|nr:hypothetical protein BOTBODRAFT_38019 [Botryobasidium botryosum FD-172 SS1]